MSLFLFCELCARLYHLVELKNFPVAPMSADAFGSYKRLIPWATELLWIQDIKNDVHSYYSPDSIIMNRPNYSVRMKNHDWEFNSYGFRHGPLTVPKPKGTFRIFMLGGSTVEGQFNAYWTISYYLEKDLRKVLPKAEVINAGVAGFGSDNELMLLKNVVLKLEPDMVIVLDGRNDLLYSMQPETSPYHSFSRILDKLVNHATVFSLTDYLGRFMARKSYFCMLLWRKLNLRGLQPHFVNLDVKKQWFHNYISNLILMKTLLEINHVYGILAFQPTFACCKDHLSPYESSIEEYFTKTQSADLFRHIGPVWKEAGQAVSAVASSDKVKIYDLACVFKDVKPTIYLDWIHYTPYGDEILAQKIMSIIQRNFLTERITAKK